jgi:hypothetical protein
MADTARQPSSPVHNSTGMMSFEEMIVTRTRGWIEEYDSSNLARVGEGVTMSMRERGDYFSYFNLLNGRQTQWRHIPGKGLVTFPIIGRSVRAKTATAVATKIQTEVEAVRDIPEKQAAAELARNIARYCRDTNWTKNTESNISNLCQLQRFCFTYSDYHEGGMVVDIPLTETREIRTGDTLYTCSNCGMQHGPEDLGIPDIADEFREQDLQAGSDSEQSPDLTNPDSVAQPSTEPSDVIDTDYDPTSGEYQQTQPAADDNAAASEPDSDDQSQSYQNPEQQRILEHTADLTCPGCSTNALVMDSRAHHERVDALTGEYERRDCGVMDTRLVSPLLIRFDSYNCLGFDYKRAAWFNYHPLVPAYELLALAPHLADLIADNKTRWSESARHHFELNNNTSSSNGYSYRQKSYPLDQLVEINVWWIEPHACVGWTSPDRYTMPTWSCDDDGNWTPDESKPAFTIEAGETMDAAWRRQFKCFDGALVIMWHDKIVGVGNESFTAKWTGIPWMVDSQSAFPKGEEKLLKLQDAATNVISMAYSHTRKRSMPTLVADPMGGFTEQGIKSIGQPGSTVIRQPISGDITDRQWQHYLGYLEPGEMSPETFQFIQFIVETAKEESGVYNEMVGNVEDQETLGGRKIGLNQSLSQMTPTQQAKALALVEHTFVWLELWQKCAPEEAYHADKRHVRRRMEAAGYRGVQSPGHPARACRHRR